MTAGCAAALDLPPPTYSSALPMIYVAAAALMNEAGAVLITQRPVGKNFAGYWEFPGGKLEAGEPPDFALMRELREELGIETRPTCFYPLGFTSYPYGDFQVVIMLYVCRVWRGTLAACEGQEFKWVPPKQLYNYTFVPADLPLIAQVIDRV